MKKQEQKKKVFFQYHPETLEYMGLYEPILSKEKTRALKKSVFMALPSAITKKEPSAEVGKCWFVNGNWTKSNPNKKTEPIK